MYTYPTVIGKKTFPKELTWIRCDSLSRDESPILHFCVNNSELHVDVFSHKKDRDPYYVKTRYLYENRFDDSNPIVFLSSLINSSEMSETLKGNVQSHSMDRNVLQVHSTQQLCAIPQPSTSNQRSQSSQQQQQIKRDIDKYVCDHVNRTAANGMTSVLVMMDRSGIFHGMEQISFEDGNLRSTPMVFPKLSDSQDKANKNSTLSAVQNADIQATYPSTFPVESGRKSNQVLNNHHPCSDDVKLKLIEKIKRQSSSTNWTPVPSSNIPIPSQSSNSGTVLV